MKILKQLVSIIALGVVFMGITRAHSAYGMEECRMTTSRMYSHHTGSARRSNYANNRRYQEISCFACCEKKESPVKRAESKNKCFQSTRRRKQVGQKETTIEEQFKQSFPLQRKSIKITGAESLFHAVLNNKVYAALQHIAAGADVNEKDSIGWASLHYAARDRNVLMARLLLAAQGIDIAAKNGQGQTPLQIVLARRDSVPDAHQSRCDTIIEFLTAHEKGEYPYHIQNNALIFTSTYKGRSYRGTVFIEKF